MGSASLYIKKSASFKKIAWKAQKVLRPKRNLTEATNKVHRGHRGSLYIEPKEETNEGHRESYEDHRGSMQEPKTKPIEATEDATEARGSL